MCTTWHIWDGKSIAFWFDSWNDQSGRVGNGYVFSKPSISLRDAWHRIHALDLNLVINREIEFSSERDRIIWTLESSGSYSSKSIYRVLASLGRTQWEFQFTWKSPIPPTVKIFAYLVLKDKILTRDSLSRGG